MKKKIILIGIKSFKICLSIVYACFKIFSVKDNRVVFISRQNDELSLDFKLIEEELVKRNPEIIIKPICCRMDDRRKGKVSFLLALIKSLRYLAISSVCVIDSYWPAVSMLNHKEELTVIQIWHALGAIKKFGYQTLGKEYGRDREISVAMFMHRKYDFVIAGGHAWNKYFAEAFDVSENQIINIGLPRIDYLLNTEKENREKVLEKYPQFNNKPVILYAPTFRRSANKSPIDLINKLDDGRYNIVIKSHPNQPIEFDGASVYYCPEFSTMEMLSISEYVITDYSAVAIEAAVLDKKTLYYLYDYEEYLKANGLNVDPMKTMPGCSFKEADSIVEIIDKNIYPYNQLKKYKDNYLPEKMGQSTSELVRVILDCLK